MRHATLWLVSPRKRGEFRYPVTDQGVRLLRVAREREDVTYRQLAKDTGVSSSSLNSLFKGTQHSIEHLPALCKRLRVPFWRTQPFSRHQARLLDALDRLLASDATSSESAVRVFETYVRGLTGGDEDDDKHTDSIEPQRPSGPTRSVT
jgi:transcriptional regulator with XRE-family HTH domain